jgi:hypothetical protein
MLCFKTSRQQNRTDGKKGMDTWTIEDDGDQEPDSVIMRPVYRTLVLTTVELNASKVFTNPNDIQETAHRNKSWSDLQSPYQVTDFPHLSLSRSSAPSLHTW